MARGKLRPDFYYRIAGLTIQVPPLRERSEDILILAAFFLRRFKERGGASYPGGKFSQASASHLQHHQWPGNVRELRNVVERSLILSRGETIEIGEVDGQVLEAELPSLAEQREAVLPEPTSEWARARLLNELRLCVEAKRRVKRYKGEQWRAEFVRLLYPECKAANAKGFSDLIKRLTQGPWGDPNWRDDPELKLLIADLMK